jgi:signal peptidase I
MLRWNFRQSGKRRERALSPYTTPRGELAVNSGRKGGIHQLVREKMLAGQPFRYHVVSDSMSPVFRTGDRILVVPGPVAAFRAGDIVLVFHRDGAVTHRLMSAPDTRGSMCLVTKGDRALAADQPWPLENVCGRVVAVDRGARSLVLQGSRWHSLVGRILVWEWRCLSGMQNRLARRILHWCCGRGVHTLTRLAWFATKAACGGG